MKWLENTKQNLKLIPERISFNYKNDIKKPTRIEGYARLLVKWKFKDTEQYKHNWDIRIGYYNPETHRFHIQGVTGTVEVSHFVIIKNPKKCS